MVGRGIRQEQRDVSKDSARPAQGTIGSLGVADDRAFDGEVTRAPKGELVNRASFDGQIDRISGREAF